MLILLLLFAFCINALSDSIAIAEEPAGEILVSAAVSLKGAFVEIAALLEGERGAKVVFNFGASGVLQKQIENGAPADVFASAAEKQMNELESKGLIQKNTRRNFAGNVLVIVVPPDAKFHPASAAELDSDKLAKIAIGNPKTAPVGEYAREFLMKVGIWERIEPKLVFSENVRQTLDYVERGEVDAGVVYQSDIAGGGAKAVRSAVVPHLLHSPIIYPIAVVRGAKNPELARKFITLISSRKGRGILKKHGFTPPARLN
ncbi:MAG: molybdate ABC transporter substrate-binding protein [Deltaproteobacteria bacterium]